MTFTIYLLSLRFKRTHTDTLWNTFIIILPPFQGVCLLPVVCASLRRLQPYTHIHMSLSGGKRKSPGFLFHRSIFVHRVRFDFSFEIYAAGCAGQSKEDTEHERLFLGRIDFCRFFQLTTTTTRALRLRLVCSVLYGAAVCRCICLFLSCRGFCPFFILQFPITRCVGLCVVSN